MSLYLFAKKEYSHRYERARELMKKEGIDALLISSEENITYFSGVTATVPWNTVARPSIFILPMEKEPILLLHELWVEPTTHDTPIDVKPYSQIRAPVELASDAFKELGLLKGKVGAELGHELRIGIPHNDYARLTSKLPNVKFVDASYLLWNLRMVKSEAEIEYMRKSCEIQNEAFEKCFEKIKGGMTEKEVIRILLEEMIKAGAERPGFTMMNSGPHNYMSENARPSDHVLEHGNVLWIDAGAVCGGYWSDYSRMAVVGKASNKQKEMHETVSEMTNNILGIVKAGVKISEIVDLSKEEYRRAGKYGEIGQVGHSVGLVMSEPPRLRDFSLYYERELEPGMVICIEPRILKKYGFFHVEQETVVTKDGNELLSTTPTDLREI